MCPGCAAFGERTERSGANEDDLFAIAGVWIGEISKLGLLTGTVDDCRFHIEDLAM
jgi:hypothetical protein